MLNTFDAITPYEEVIVPVHLRTVVPIMRTFTNNGLTYSLTHMKQYENCSMLKIELETGEGSHLLLSKPDETHIEIDGEESYESVIQMSSYGGYITGPTKLAMDVMIRPTLPDDLAGIELTLAFGGPFVYQSTALDFASRIRLV